MRGRGRGRERRIGSSKDIKMRRGQSIINAADRFSLSLLQLLVAYVNRCQGMEGGGEISSTVIMNENQD